MIFQLSRNRTSLDHFLSAIEVHRSSIQLPSPASSVNFGSNLFSTASFGPANASAPRLDAWGDVFTPGCFSYVEHDLTGLTRLGLTEFPN
jgi:hypothetical protein